MSLQRPYTVVATMLFILFLALPIGALVLLGASAPYGRPFKKIPERWSEFIGQDHKQIIEGLLERSPIRRDTIKLYNRMSYHVLGYVDTPVVVSGRDGWLFNKPQFWDGRCKPDADFLPALRRIDILAALAEAAELEVHFTVSPDKISIYPEMLHPRAARLANCRVENGERWRRLAATFAPDLIDHTVPLLAQKEKHNQQVFYATDTHWNRVGGALAVNQLVAAVSGPMDSRTQKTLTYEPTKQNTDMRNRTLFLSDLEPVPAQHILLQIPTQTHRKMIFINDSFYALAQETILAAFPNSEFLHIEKVSGDHAALLQRPEEQVVVINSVERFFFQRFATAFATGVPAAITALNMAKAEKCSFKPAPEILFDAKLQNLSRDAEGYVATNQDPQIVLTLPKKGTQCISIVLTLSEPGVFEIFLPPLKGRPSQHSFEPGRSLAISLTEGKHKLRFIVPANLSERRLRIDPINRPSRFSIDTIEFGTIKRERVYVSKTE